MPETSGTLTSANERGSRNYGMELPRTDHLSTRCCFSMKYIASGKLELTLLVSCVTCLKSQEGHMAHVGPSARRQRQKHLALQQSVLQHHASHGRSPIHNDFITGTQANKIRCCALLTPMVHVCFIGLGRVVAKFQFLALSI
eukprot:2461478-Amphidinium_carterae.1